jgi:xylose isomerase
MDDIEKLKLGIVLMYLESRNVKEITAEYHSYNRAAIVHKIDKFYVDKYKKHQLQKNIIRLLGKHFEHLLRVQVNLNDFNVDKHNGTIILYTPDGDYTIKNTETITRKQLQKFSGKLLNR